MLYLSVARLKLIEGFVAKLEQGRGMTGNKKKENRHSATDAEQCKIMAKLNGWKLLYIEPNANQTLKVDCIFEGEQTSFAPKEKNDE